MPGGVDSHCHIEQLQAGGGADEETFVTGSTSALAGGTTSVITFSTQFKGHGILEPLAEYRRRAAKAMVDYSFHQIITDASDEVIFNEVPQVVASGVRSLKVFLTYDPLHLDDRAVPARAGGGPPRRRAGHGALRELRGDQLAHRGVAGGRPDGAEISRLVAPKHDRAGGHPPRDRTGRNWSISRSRSSTSPAPKSPTKSLGRRPAA